MLGNPVFVHACWLAMIVFAVNTSSSNLMPQVETKPHPTENKKIEQIQPTTPPSETAKNQNKDLLAPSRKAPFGEEPNPIVHASMSSNINESSRQNFDQQQKLKFHQFVANTKLYYLGVYESNAQEYTTEEQRSRKQECESNQISQDCWAYAYRAKKEVEKTVTVHINSHNDISLILSSYEPAKWIITGNTQRVKFVYLTGYQASDISIPAVSSKTIYASFYNGSACNYCLLSNMQYFYGYELNSRINSTVENYFGKSIDLFQGQYKTNRFYVN